MPKYRQEEGSTTMTSFHFSIELFELWRSSKYTPCVCGNLLFTSSETRLAAASWSGPETDCNNESFLQFPRVLWALSVKGRCQQADVIENGGGGSAAAANSKPAQTAEVLNSQKVWASVSRLLNDAALRYRTRRPFRVISFISSLQGDWLVK